MRRLILILLVALALSPGLVWRTPLPPMNYSQQLSVTPLEVPKGAEARIGGAGGPVVTGAWRLESPNTTHGSYSALVASDANTLLAISDRGKFLRFAMPGKAGVKPALGTVLPGTDQYKTAQDMESATRDPPTGRLWIGLEFKQAIMRLDPDLTHPVTVAPPQMRHWRSNGGPEAMVRLADGRFVVLAESRIHWRDETRPALLFPGDPAEGAEPQPFRFAPPDGYDPADMAQLPDGRVLILFRGLQFVPPGFAVRLAIADPAEIRPGKLWRWRDMGPIQRPVPMDNYEGLAVTGGENGAPVTIWLISDDNGSRILQRTLLLRLEWRVPPKP